MPAFPIAADPTSEKLRGGYYTPAEIAAFLAKWVSESSRRVLEPSCGDGAIVKFVPIDVEVTGIELDEAEAFKARQVAPTAEITSADFFEWFTRDKWGAWDGVVGNPPFIRFGNWHSSSRDTALDLMRELGMRPTKLTNAWVPFVVASTLAVREGGRIGLVVPAELLQVTYAAELRAFLVDNFSELTVVAFKQLVFEGVLQEVVLLLGIKGRGPARIKVTEVESVHHLPEPAALVELPHAPALRHDSEKWTKYLLDAQGIEALRTVSDAALVHRLADFAAVDVGIVTGRNRFFVLTPSEASSRDLDRYLSPLVGRSAHLQGIRFERADFTLLLKEDAPCQLLALDESSEPLSDPFLLAYIQEGESEGVHEGYKCSIRRKWWVVPSQWVPDAFLLRQIYDHPRIIANHTAATSTDTIHRVRMLNGLAPAKLAAGSINSVTFAFSEVLGRSYGGGVLELEPREAENLPVPHCASLTSGDVSRVDQLVRDGKLIAALDFVDRKLLGHVDPGIIEELRAVWIRLRDRRLARGKRKAA